MTPNPNKTSALAGAAAELTATIKPLLHELERIRSLTGIVVFIPDNHHTKSAGAIAGVTARRPARLLAFTKQHILGRRVDLQASTLGAMFAGSITGLAPSKLNPQHLVYGLKVGRRDRPDAILQLAFDQQAGAEPPSSEVLLDHYSGHKNGISLAVDAITRAGANVPSLADALMLATPTTPNAHVIMWDVVHSSRHARSNYAGLRSYLNEFAATLNLLLSPLGGTVTSLKGDGQNIVIPFPEHLDRSNHAAIAEYEHTVIEPLIAQIQRAHQLASADRRIDMRLAWSAAHVEYSHFGEATGPEFFQIARRLKHHNS